MTSAGPTAYQASGSTKTARVGWTSRRKYDGRRPISRPAATSSGTSAGGARMSIGMSTSWLGNRVADPHFELDLLRDDEGRDQADRDER